MQKITDEVSWYGRLLQKILQNYFSVIAEPLTNLLSKRIRFKWTTDCQNALDKLKATLRSEPVLLAPNFNKEFKLAVDASDMVQVEYCWKKMTKVWITKFVTFPKKFNKHQKNLYSRERMLVSHSCSSTLWRLSNFSTFTYCSFQR